MAYRQLKNTFFSALILLATVGLPSEAAELSSLSWNQVCFGKMGDEWYGSDEARSLADRVLYLQRDNGGWMKNYEVHKLSPEEVETIHNEHDQMSYLDNNSTTQEMQFLARVYSRTGIESYRESFNRALQMIFEAQKTNGGWSQTWPLRGQGAYHDYITFNDNLMANVLRILHDTASNRSYFNEIVDGATRQKCDSAFDCGIELVIKCQVDDNGVPSAWCAQHHNTTLTPAEGRPFELPSISGYESISLLSYLMSLENPSTELQTTVRTAIAWLDAHRIPDKALETFTTADGMTDYRIVDRPGNSLWARFIQLGGETGESVYNEFFKMLRDRGKKRQYHWNGKLYTYSEYEIAKTSYDPTRAYQPLYSIYDSEYPHLYYRFLYNYEDTEPVANSDGLPLATSLGVKQRSGYNFMGNWGETVIDKEYPEWERRMLTVADSDGYDLHLLSNATYIDSDISGTNVNYRFPDGVTISNHSNKQHAEGNRNTNTIKYSREVEYTIHLPDDMEVSRIRFTGYNNYANADAYLRNCNGKIYPPSSYVFPAKDEAGNTETVSYMIDFNDNPVSGSINFSLGGNQCALIITLYSKADQSGITDIVLIPADNDAGCYDLQGRRVDPATSLRPGIYIRKNGKFIVR